MSSWSRPQDVVEKALAASTVDGQVAFVVESSEANLRWAKNSLTTNGAMRSRHVVVSTPDRFGALDPRAGSTAAAGDVSGQSSRRAKLPE